MKIGCCIDISFYDTLVEAGYESIALAAKDIVAFSEDEFKAVKAKLASGSLATISVNSFCTPELKLNGPLKDKVKVREYTELVAARSTELGFKYIGIGAPQSRNVEAGYDYEKAMDEFADSVDIMCDVAAKYDADILIESVCSLECNFMCTTREAISLANKMKHSNLGIVYDIYHEYMEQQPVEVISEAGALIKVVHIAQDEGGKRAYLRTDEAATYKKYWDALNAIGYTGEWNMECFIGDPSKELFSSMDIMQNIKKGN